MATAKLVERLLATVLLMVAIAAFVFVVMRMLPGDPVDRILGSSGTVTQQQLAALRASYHLDQPLPLQLLSFLGGLAHGDLGESIVGNRPVTSVILAHLPATVELTLAASLFAILVSIPLGVITAVRRKSWLDRVTMALSYLGVSMPGFWLGIVLIIVFAVRLRLLPVGGRTDPGVQDPGPTGLVTLDFLLSGDLAGFASAASHLVLPGVTLAAAMIAVLTRVLRSSMVEELQKEYVVFARAMGASESRVVVVHALRNALMPVVTLFGLELGTLLGGNMIVETVFSWPGVGQLAVASIFARDYPLVQGVVILYACTFAVLNVLVDLSYSRLNPRVSL